MRTSLYLAAALTVGTALTAVPAAHAQTRVQQAQANEQLATPLIPPKLPPQAVPQEVTAAWGCVLMGSAGTIAALSANSVNLINVVAGGIVTPANPAVLYLGLAGVVFTSFCTLGQQLTPLYVYYFRDQPANDVDVAKEINPRIAAVTGRPLSADEEEPAYPWQSAQ